MKCIFLVYSRLQQGYWCYSPDTHRYFVFVDVTFFEQSTVLPTPSLDVLSLSLLYPIPGTTSIPLATPRQLQVYTRRPCIYTGPLADSSPITPSSMTSILLSLDDLLIAIRKGTRSSHNPHPIYNFPTYHCLSSPYSAFIFTLSSVSLLEIVQEALSYPGWEHAMVKEMAALHSTSTWDLVTLHVDKSHVVCS